ncbi:MAG: CDP-alcohol phosphatidyltransferase family protein [Stagnimonas sp.]|nr:CDP-alcohol phosphatidyltransferase family protein [Stagnimonas sp.]
MTSASPTLPRALILGNNPTPLWGMPAAERLRRALVRAGIREVQILGHAALPALSGPVLLVSNRWVFDETLLKDLSKQPDTLLVDSASGRLVAALVGALEATEVAAVIAADGSADGLPRNLRRADAVSLSGAFNNALRKREAPYLLRLEPRTRDAVERRMFDASYKGVTDLVTKYLWPRPAQLVTSWCARLGISPNQVTFVGLLLVLASFWLFWHGHYGWGLLSGWLMTFLDTVDGKLARVTLTSSAIGNVFDHGIDLIHPPFWWWAWVIGLGAYGTPLAGETVHWVLWVILAGYVLQRILEGIFMRSFGMHVHVWRPFDSFFRLITARRNPNLVILTPAWLLGRPDIGIVLVALWTGACLLVHAVQIMQGLAARRHGKLESWLSRG